MLYSNYSSLKKMFVLVLRSQSHIGSYDANVILMLMDGRVIEKKSKNQTKYFLFVKTSTQTLATAKRRYSEQIYLVFVAVNHVEVFSHNITHSVTRFN